MNKKTLVNIGERLVLDLEYHAAQYHVKSDSHEILSWGVVGVKGMVKQLLSDLPLTYSLSDSTLLSEWGDSLAGEHPDLANRVQEFRKIIRNKELLRFNESGS